MPEPGAHKNTIIVLQGHVCFLVTGPETLLRPLSCREKAKGKEGERKEKKVLYMLPPAQGFFPNLSYPRVYQETQHCFHEPVVP